MTAPPGLPRAIPQPGGAPGGARRGRRPDKKQSKAFWIALAAPGIIWLILLFIVPFYAVLAIAMGQLNRLFESPIAVWNPFGWSSSNVINVWHDLFGATSFAGPIVLRTIGYVAAASVLSLLIAYPAAYFVARFSGRRKALFLILLIAPFWISFMMRMLAWIDLLQTNGYVNRVLSALGLISQPVNWLGGKWYTVVLGLVYGYIPYLILVLFAGLDRIDPALIEAGRDLGLNRVRTFVRVTLPLSRQAILTGMLITVLPMVGDYFTNQLLSGAANTSMVGNLIQGQLGTPGLEGQGAVLSLLLLLVLLVPMIYYVISTNRSTPGGSVTATSAPARAAEPSGTTARTGLSRLLPRRNPWGHPWFLEGFTWLYLIWSLVPIAIAVLFSFNNGKSQAAWQGFSWRWYFTDPVNSVLHNPQLHAAVIQTVRLSVLTTIIAVPLGVAFALGINRWRGVTSSTFNYVMILSFVIPELIFGVAMFFVFTVLFTSVHLGTLAEVLGLVTWNVSWPAIIVQARLVTLGRQYEEAAADLGANQASTMRRVMIPLLGPAIFASAVLVFSGVIDDFVIVDLLSSNASNTPMSVIIYSTQHGGNGGPALNALGTIMLVMSLIVAGLGYVAYRWATRGERGSGVEALTTIAGSE